MKHNKFTLKNTDENDMVSDICFDGFKTEVHFGFRPENVKYLGMIDIETLEENI